MAVEGVPWMVAGASHSADIGRIVAFAATGGETGIATATDLKVTATGTPSNQVQVAPGSASLVSLYPSAGGQSYIIRNQTTTLVNVSAAPAGATLTRYLIAFVEDPQYGGASPTAIGGTVLAGPYVQFKLVSTLAGILYPYIALARLDQPASTATVLQSYITDLRKLANPRRVSEVVSIYPTGVLTAGQPIPTGAYSSWPITTAQRPTLSVPSWATKMEVVANFSGVYFVGTSRTVAGIRVGFGSSGADNGIIMESETGRPHYTVVGTHDISLAQRGTDQLINLQGWRTSGTGMWYADYQTSISLQVSFKEVVA